MAIVITGSASLHVYKTTNTKVITPVLYSVTRLV